MQVNHAGKTKSVLDALMRATNRADKYRSVVIVGITDGGLHKEVTWNCHGDMDFQLIAALIQAISVEMALGRMKA